MTATSDDPADDALLRDWQEIQEKILASAIERQKRTNRQPERFRDSGLDPRGWQQHCKGFSERSIASVREHEVHYLRAGGAS